MANIKLNLGCGYDIREGYTNMDIEPVSDEIIKHDVEDLSDFADNSVSEILAFDVIEHFPHRKINPIIKEWCRVICPGGKLVIQTPDIEVIFNEYYKQALEGLITWKRLSIIIHGKDEPFQTHYVSLSFDWLKEILGQHGMSVISKEKTAQNMKVIAQKNPACNVPKVSSSICLPSRISKASKFCMFRLRIVRFLRYMCRRHGLIRSMHLDTLSNFAIKWVLMPRPRKPVIVPVDHGFDLVVNPKNQIGFQRRIFEDGTCQAGTLGVIKKCLRKGDTFLDVGSNIGLIAILASKTVGDNGKVHAFEPEPQNFSILSENIKINRADNIKAHKLALGSCKSTEDIFRQKHKREAATLMGPEGNMIYGGKVRVEGLDEFLDNNNIGPVKMMRVDVEGWELEVLKGAAGLLASSQAPIISINYSYLHSTYGGLMVDVYNMICSSNDYRIFKLRYGKNRVSRLVEIKAQVDLPYSDDLFCFLPKHLSQLDPDLFEKPEVSSA